MLADALRRHRAGRPAEAERIYRRILEIDSRHADSLHLLGMIAFGEGRHDAAVEMITHAVAIHPKAAAYHSNLGTVLQAQGRLSEAAASYQRALALSPDFAEIHCNLGNIFQAQERLEEAVNSYERALALKPELAEAHVNLGNVFQAQGKLRQAVESYERALALKPEYAEAHYNLGRAWFSLGNAEEALARHTRALALQPDHAGARFSQSLAQLAMGDFAEGWANYESRWQIKDRDTPWRAYPQPRWKRERLESGRLLIWGEQGVGDEIMFAGLIADVIRTGNRCVLDCDARLQPLFARSFPDVEAISGHRPGDRPELDIAAQVPSGSLPGIFRSCRAAFAGTASPYLLADPAAREEFRARYADGRRLVGLAWHTKNRRTGRERSIDLPLLSPLFARSGIRWISLQYGERSALEDQAAAAGAPILIDPSVDQMRNIDAFAAQIAALDLVVTIDNSAAHLAAALGIPVWLLLPYGSDWRWLHAGDRSLWYPAMRLFRQCEPGNWRAVIESVKTAL
jgi:tetratricopeptide (TPR) repeat protein